MPLVKSLVGGARSPPPRALETAHFRVPSVGCTEVPGHKLGSLGIHTEGRGKLEHRKVPY